MFDEATKDGTADREIARGIIDDELEQLEREFVADVPNTKIKEELDNLRKNS